MPSALLNNSGLVALVFAAAAAAIAAYIIDHRRWAKRTRGLPLPPGPLGKPLIGNILSVPIHASWLTFTQYKEKYGDLIHFHGLGSNILVLNSLEAMSDLLDKRGNIYSDRPSLVVAGELMGFDRGTGLLRYGDEWRAHRKLGHVSFTQTAVKKYHRIQEDMAALLNKEILENPDDFFSLVVLAAGRIILSVTYGLSVKAVDSEYITQAQETLEIINRAIIPGKYLADHFPILKYAPSWVPFQKDAKHGRATVDQFVNKPFEYVKREMKSGTAAPSLARDFLQSPLGTKCSADHEYLVKWATGTLYSAGAETTQSTVQIFIMAMALHPDVQRRAQAEIDHVIGNNRMPLISDCPHLPFIAAVIKETFRWHPVLPLGIAHRNQKDDVYKGNFIPAGTVVLENIWAVAFEPNEKYDPQVFIPDRFLDPTQNIVDPSTYVFGFGRRICPGRFLGENSVFILIANLLSAFDILPPSDGELTREFGTGLMSTPKPFKCRIQPRSEAKSKLILERVAQCTV